MRRSESRRTDFYNLIINKSAAGVTVTSTSGLTVTNGLILTQGTWDAATFTHTIANGWDSSSVNFLLTEGTSTIRLQGGTAPVTLRTKGLGDQFQFLQISIDTDQASTLDVFANLTVDAGVTLDTNSQNTQVGGTTTIDGTLQGGAGTVTLNGSLGGQASSRRKRRGRPERDGRRARDLHRIDRQTSFSGATVDFTGTTFSANGGTAIFDGTTNLTNAGNTFGNVQLGTALVGGSLTKREISRSPAPSRS